MAIPYEELAANFDKRIEEYLDNLEKKIDFQMKVRYFGGDFKFQEFDVSFMTPPVLEKLQGRYGGYGWEVEQDCNVLTFRKAKTRPKCCFDDPPKRWLLP